MKKIKVGVLGGTRGMDFLTRVLFNHPFAEVTAICEKYPVLKEKIESESKNLGSHVTVFEDYDEFANICLNNDIGDPSNIPGKDSTKFPAGITKVEAAQKIMNY